MSRPTSGPAHAFNPRHGGPYDRGQADAWYARPMDPHYYEGPTGMSRRVPASEMTPEELVAYGAGYADGPWDGKGFSLGLA